MYRHARLLFRIIVIVWALYVLATRSEHVTDLSDSTNQLFVTWAEFQSTQSLTSTDRVFISSSTPNLDKQMHHASRDTKRSFDDLQKVAALSTEDSIIDDMNGVSVTNLFAFSNRENNENPKIKYSTYKSIPDLTTDAFESRVSSDIKLEQNISNHTHGIESTTTNPKQKMCHQYGGCDMVPGPYWYCQCDDLCQEYNDCCRDYDFTKQNATQTYTCVSIDDSPANLWGIQAVSICPDNYTNSSTITQCSRGSVTNVGPPVLDIDYKTRVYKNKYCALCHGARTVSLGIAFTVNPSLFDEIGNLLNLSNVDFQDYLFRVATYRFLIPEDANVRYCLINIVRNEDYYCNLYSNPVLLRDDGKFYRNENCKESPGDESPTTCVYTIMESLIAYLMRSSILSLKKMTILFSFNPNNELSTGERCQEWSQENDKNCAHLAKYVNASFDCDFNIVLSQYVGTVDIMQSILLSLFVKEIRGFVTVGRPSMVLVNENLTLVHVKVGCTMQKLVFAHELTNIKRRINNQRVVITEENNEKLRLVISNERLDVNILIISEQFRPTMNYVRKRRKYYSQNGISLPDFDWSELCDDVRMVFKRFTHKPLHIISLVCQSKILDQRRTPFLAILTLVFSGVSCVSLVVMIVYNRLQCLHHEIPFSNLENLCISIIFSNIFLFIGQMAPYINNWLCYIVSILSHFLWLAVFSFTSLAVTYIVKTLMQLKNRRIKTNRCITRKRVTMTGIGLIVPLLFVTPAIIIDQHGPTSFSPGYANNNICFPVKFPRNFIFFTGPVLAMIIINAVCIIQIMARVHLARVAASNIRQSSTFSEAKIFLRMLSISGCFWITGILAAYFRSEWLEYVFTILCGLQGLFVAIANLTTRRIRCFRSTNENTDET